MAKNARMNLGNLVAIEVMSVGHERPATRRFVQHLLWRHMFAKVWGVPGVVTGTYSRHDFRSTNRNSCHGGCNFQSSA